MSLTEMWVAQMGKVLSNASVLFTPAMVTKAQGGTWGGSLQEPAGAQCAFQTGAPFSIGTLMCVCLFVCLPICLPACLLACLLVFKTGFLCVALAFLELTV